MAVLLELVYGVHPSVHSFLRWFRRVPRARRSRLHRYRKLFICRSVQFSNILSVSHDIVVEREETLLMTIFTQFRGRMRWAGRWRRRRAVRAARQPTNEHCGRKVIFPFAAGISVSSECDSRRRVQRLLRFSSEERLQRKT